MGELSTASIPKSLLDQLRESNPNVQSWSEEARALLNPSIAARPMHLPQAGAIKRILNKEYKYKMARDLNGQNPNHDRVEQLKAEGWEMATTKDVEMASQATVKSENEIRNGDTVLMKIPMKRYLEIEKDRLERSISMAYGTREDGPVMSNARVPGIRSTITGEDSIDEIRSKATVSDASEELRTGEIRGNASVAKIRKE
jgi:hypothetical protein